MHEEKKTQSKRLVTLIVIRGIDMPNGQLNVFMSTTGYNFVFLTTV